MRAGFAATSEERYDEEMPRIAILVLFSVSVCTLASPRGFGQQPAKQNSPPTHATAAAKGEALIDALASYPFGEIYSEDITHPNSIAYAGKKVAENVDGIIPAPPVRAIADLGEPAIPLLISHLTDQRLSRAEYRQQPVPVGYLALDLLLHMTDMNDERVIVPGCEQHGLGDCMQPDFYFDPDTKDPNTMASVQKDWSDENKKEPIKLVYPAWWR